MDFYDINPFIRFAERISYLNSSKSPVFVLDCRILYITSGKADLYIESEHYELVPGSLFYCSAGSVYRFQAAEAKIIALNFDLTQRNNRHTEPYSRISVSDKTVLPHVDAETVRDNEFLNSHRIVPNAEGFLKSLEKILEEFSTQKIYYHEKSGALLKELLVELYRCSISPASGSTTAISQILDYIKENYHKPLDNIMLSAMSGYHKNHLNRLFIKHTGTSVHKYILNIRINEAKKLLLTTEHSLTYISEKVGFNSNTHFSSYFKQIVGVSPLKFRKQFKT